MVITCARSASRRSVSATACAVVPPTPVDLVEDHGLAACDGRDRERDAGQLPARRRVRDRPER
jgi:hypothetical protein